ncbi:unnamed protein product [Gordionus sp. m RMFG-2023]
MQKKINNLLKLNPKRYVEFTGPFNIINSTFLELKNESLFDIYFEIQLYDDEILRVTPDNGTIKSKKNVQIQICLLPCTDMDKYMEMLKHDIKIRGYVKSQYDSQVIHRNTDAFKIVKRLQPVLINFECEEEAKGSQSMLINEEGDELENEYHCVNSPRNVHFDSPSDENLPETHGDALKEFPKYLLNANKNDSKLDHVSETSFKPSNREQGDGLKNNAIFCYHCRNPMIKTIKTITQRVDACSVCKVPYGFSPNPNFNTNNINYPNLNTINFPNLNPNYINYPNLINPSFYNKGVVKDVSVRSDLHQTLIHAKSDFNKLVEEAHPCHSPMKVEIRSPDFEAIIENFSHRDGENLPIVLKTSRGVEDLMTMDEINEKQEEIWENLINQKKLAAVDKHLKNQVIEIQQKLSGHHRDTEVRKHGQKSAKHFKKKKSAKPKPYSADNNLEPTKLTETNDKVLVSRSHVSELLILYEKVQNQIFCVLECVKKQDYSKDLLMSLSDLTNHNKFIPLYVCVFLLSLVLGVATSIML